MTKFVGRAGRLLPPVQEPALSLDRRLVFCAAVDRKSFLLQSNRRDMGGGVVVPTKDVSAPIIVRGRHWGGLHLACKV